MNTGVDSHSLECLGVIHEAPVAIVVCRVGVGVAAVEPPAIMGDDEDSAWGERSGVAGRDSGRREGDRMKGGGEEGKAREESVERGGEVREREEAHWYAEPFLSAPGTSRADQWSPSLLRCTSRRPSLIWIRHVAACGAQTRNEAVPSSCRVRPWRSSAGKLERSSGASMQGSSTAACSVTIVSVALRVWRGEGSWWMGRGVRQGPWTWLPSSPSMPP
jgi:hypothetical protein